MDGVEKYKIRNSVPTGYREVEVYAGDPWHGSPNAVLRNFIFKNGQFDKSFKICPSQFYSIKIKQLLGVVPSIFLFNIRAYWHSIDLTWEPGVSPL